MDGSVLETGYRLSLCVTGGLIAVLLLRLPLRYAFGSRIAYRIWLVVPIAAIGLVIGSLTPTRAFTPLALPMQVLEVHLPWSSVPTVPSSSGQIPWVALGWALGAVLFALLQWWQQHTFVRRLGVLRPVPNGAWMSESADIGPAVVGVFPPRMVLPPDFYQRFTAPEQTFALAHETMHIARRDPLANLIVATVRSLFWFHPFVHLAVRYFRIDQELACDANVLGAHTQDRHHYARAILKSQLSNPTLPVGCHLDSQAAVFLKRRFYMLQAPLPSRGRHMLGITAIIASVLISGSVAWAQNPVRILEQNHIPTDGNATQYEVAFKLWERGTLIVQPIATTIAGLQTDIRSDNFEFQFIALPYPSDKGPDILLWLKVYDRSDSLVVNQKVQKSWNVLRQKRPTRIEWKGGVLEVVARARQ